MPRSRNFIQRAALAAALLLSLPLHAAPPSSPRPYHLVLEALPAAVFPYLRRFGTVDPHVYRSGVRAEALWLKSFSRNGDAAVTVMNPLARMYVEMELSEIAPVLRNLAGAAGQVERNASAAFTGTLRGTVGGHPAVRHRLSYGPAAWIDVWTTTALPEHPQVKRIMLEMLRGISPGSVPAASRIHGTPILVELNFRRFQKVRLLTMKALSFEVDPDDEHEALEVGSLYVRGSVLEKLWQ